MLHAWQKSSWLNETIFDSHTGHTIHIGLIETFMMDKRTHEWRICGRCTYNMCALQDDLRWYWDFHN